jgi:hypothetical protein
MTVIEMTKEDYFLESEQKLLIAINASIALEGILPCIPSLFHHFALNA